MQLSRNLFLATLLMIMVTGCDNFMLDEEEAMFDTYYYHPNKEEPIHLGLIKGLNNCRLAVQSHRVAVGKKKYKGDYVCCLVTKKSSCEKRME